MEHNTPGSIPASEVGTVLQMLGVQLDVSQLYEAVKQLDPKTTGQVKLQDFLVWVKGLVHVAGLVQLPVAPAV